LIRLLATGGTIGHKREYKRPISGKAVLERTVTPPGVDVDVVDVAAVPSWAVDQATMVEVASRARAAIVDDGCAGVVVTHGTDTMEETAWLTELLLGADVVAAAPVLFTGAMRLADDPEPDGPGNLAHAFRLAAAAGGAGLGYVGLAFAGRVHAARWVTKAHATALDPYSSWPHEMDERPPPAPANGGRFVEDVALIKTWPGMPAVVLTAAVDAGARGVVLEGTGNLHVPGAIATEADRLAASGIPIVVASRAVTPPGQWPAGGTINANGLSAPKARIALGVALADDPDPVAVASWFALL